MQLAGIAAGEVLGLVRDARKAAGEPAPVAVSGVLAAELVRALRGDGDPGDAVRAGTADGAAAVVVVLAGEPTAADEQTLRDAVRDGVPVVAVQTDPRAAAAPLAYVPAESVVVCPPGRGFPVDEVAVVLARLLGGRAVALAARAPRLREPIVRELVRRASLRAAMAGALPWRKGADFPVLALIQARLVLDVAAAYGRPLDRERVPDLAAVAGAGLGARALVRRLPSRVPLLGGITGYLGTRALGEAAVRRFSAAA